MGDHRERLQLEIGNPRNATVELLVMKVPHAIISYEDQGKRNGNVIEKSTWRTDLQKHYLADVHQNKSLMAVLTPKHADNKPLEHISSILPDNGDDEIIDVDELKHRVST
jgi:hypothetical protein